MTKLLSLLRSTRAATAIEYGLIAGLIAVACLGAFQAFADAGMTKWNEVEDAAVASTN